MQVTPGLTESGLQHFTTEHEPCQLEQCLKGIKESSIDHADGEDGLVQYTELEGEHQNSVMNRQGFSRWSEWGQAEEMSCRNAWTRGKEDDTTSHLQQSESCFYETQSEGGQKSNSFTETTRARSSSAHLFVEVKGLVLLAKGNLQKSWKGFKLKGELIRHLKDNSDHRRTETKGDGKSR